MNYNYRVNGINLNSEIELPELLGIVNQEPDVWIKIGCVPDHLPNPIGSGVLYEASQDDFLLILDTVAKYRVQNGKYITIEPTKTANPEEIRLFLFASAMGALLIQQGKLAIHGSCIAIEKKGVIFTGRSSAGKSTLAAGLHSKGYSVITDDIAVLDTTDKDKNFVFPGIPHLKLWKDVLYHMNESINLEKVRPQLEKYRKPVPSLEHSNPVLLDKIVLLTTKNTPGFHFEEVLGTKKFDLLIQNTYRAQLVEKHNQLESHFNKLSKLASTIRLFNVTRPSSPMQVMELANYVEETIFQI